MTLEEFRQTYCYNCGSIQCSGTDDMLESCPDYRKEFKEADQDAYEEDY